MLKIVIASTIRFSYLLEEAVKSIRLVTIALSLVWGLWSSSALAGSWTKYLASYRIGLELRSSTDKSDLKYVSNRPALMPEGCNPIKVDASIMDCTAQIGPKSKTTYGISIQQVFKRQGWWYFGKDIGFSFFLLDAKAHEMDEDDAVIVNPQPLQQARVHLYGLNLKGYIQFGVTPPSILPDFLISIGGGLHTSTGNVKIGEAKEKVNIASGLLYFQMEAVWWRFGDGYLSSYLALENAGSHRLRGDYDQFKEVRLRPSSTSIGIVRLVLPFSTR